jgi:RNA polymerase sigma-70 factor (ECF subfamily)
MPHLLHCADWIRCKCESIRCAASAQRVPVGSHEDFNFAWCQIHSLIAQRGQGSERIVRESNTVLFIGHPRRVRIPPPGGRVGINMESPHDREPNGPFEARYVAFLETLKQLRPSLHRYCARMTGSVVDGEDVVQEALFQAYRKLDTFDDARPLGPWLFRIAHNRCIDFLRRRGVREEAETGAPRTDSVGPVDPPGPALGRAVEHLVVMLPPMERACVLLKDVLDYSLEDIAELVDSTVGGVKSALNRGRSKLATVRERTTPPRAKSADAVRLLDLYVERFNHQDWDGLRELIAADARLRVADRFAGPMADSPYFGNYSRMADPWRLAVGEVDGEPAVIVLHRSDDGWTPHSLVHLDITDHRITRIADYWHTPWVLEAATSVVVSHSV